MAPYFSILELKFIEIFSVSALIKNKGVTGRGGNPNEDSAFDNSAQGNGDLPSDHLLESRTPRRRPEDDEMQSQRTAGGQMQFNLQ